MSTLKQSVIKSVSMLAEDVNVDDIMYQVYLLGKIEKGGNDIVNGRTVTTGKLRNKAKSW